MTIELQETVAGLAPIVGSAISAAATGSKIVYLSGQVGTLEDGSPAGETLEAQTAQAFRNIQVALAANGATTSDIAKVTFYIVDWDMEKLGGLMAGAIEGLGDDLTVTATTLVGVQTLFEPGWLIEIDVTAVVD
ncbi:MAG TPA: RidA family protein [Acidimicrobiia bacterium]|jgi:enamine deaminase RidA (YjgF/YER057c/UK114 family)